MEKQEVCTVRYCFEPLAIRLWSENLKHLSQDQDHPELLLCLSYPLCGGELLYFKMKSYLLKVYIRF